MPSSVEIEQPKQVFVEGNDELRIFRALLRHLDLSNIQMQNLGGIDSLRTSLRIFKNRPGFDAVRSLAVVVDADTNRDARRDQMRGALLDAGLPAPAQPLQLMSDGPLSVAYLIVPHDNPGTMIEDVCLESVRTDPAMKCVEGYFECISQAGVTGPSAHWNSKARAHAFLASREGPGLRLGEAADSGVWPLDHGAFDQLRSLLTML